MTVQEIEQQLLPKFFKTQLSKMRGIQNFGVRTLVSETSDVVTDASIDFIKALRSGSIRYEGDTAKLYRLFCKFVSMSLSKHRSGRMIKSRKTGEYVYPERTVLPYAKADQNDTVEKGFGATQQTKNHDLREAVEALETDPRFENLRRHSIEGWGPYELGSSLGCSWYLASKKVEEERELFVKMFNAKSLV